MDWGSAARSESDLWRLAQQAVRRHGVRAPAVAADCARRLPERGRLEDRRAALRLERSSWTVN